LETKMRKLMIVGGALLSLSLAGVAHADKTGTLGGAAAGAVGGAVVAGPVGAVVGGVGGAVAGHELTKHHRHYRHHRHD
jgi:uncharacterized membrane protein